MILAHHIRNRLNSILPSPLSAEIWVDVAMGSQAGVVWRLGIGTAGKTVSAHDADGSQMS
jgi:hypothetical protein